MAQLGLDPVEGARLADGEKYGDWYRDPWSWPEFGNTFAQTLDFEEHFDVVREGKQPRSSLMPAFHVFDVPKSFMGMRPAVVQDPKSRLAFTVASAAIAERRHEDLNEWVFGWRYRDGQLTSTNDEWQLYEESKASIAQADHAAQTDITSFFASVDVRDFLEGINQKSLRGSVVAAVLGAHDDMSTRSGLPQRSLASSLLAHLALGAIDDLIRERLAAGDISHARRWMDDITFEGDEPALYRLLLDIQTKARQAGLEVNLGKTFLITGQESAEKLEEEAQKRITLPRVPGSTASGGGASYLDPSGLEDLEHRALKDPTKASRSLLVAILRSLRRYEMFDRANDWMDNARYLPHAADALGRYLAASRDDQWSTGHVQWFQEVASGSWSFPPWATAQLALAFSSDDLPPEVAAIFRDWLGSSVNLQQLAVAVHRLAVADPATVRSVLSSRLDRNHDPLVQRLFALGLVAAGGSQRQSERALRGHPSNSLTLNYLEWREWSLPGVSGDFDPRDAGEFPDDDDDDEDNEDDGEGETEFLGF